MSRTPPTHRKRQNYTGSVVSARDGGKGTNLFQVKKVSDDEATTGREVLKNRSASRIMARRKQLFGLVRIR